MISEELMEGLEDIYSDLFTTQDNILNIIYLIDSIIPNSTVSNNLRKISLDIEKNYKSIRKLVYSEIDNAVSQSEKDYNKTVMFYTNKTELYVT